MPRKPRHYIKLKQKAPYMYHLSEECEEDERAGTPRCHRYIGKVYSLSNPHQYAIIFERRIPILPGPSPTNNELLSVGTYAPTGRDWFLSHSLQREAEKKGRTLATRLGLPLKVERAQSQHSSQPAEPRITTTYPIRKLPYVSSAVRGLPLPHPPVKSLRNRLYGN